MSKYNAVSGIYVIANTKNGKVYIGQAQNIQNRWIYHKRQLNGCCHHNRYLQASWNKYGSDAFKFQILERCSVDLLNEREQHYLDIYIPKGMCYNIAVDAKAPMRGIKQSQEQIQKRIQTNTGLKRSPETRKKLSEKAKNRDPFTEEHRRKLSESHKGKTLSEETKAKIGQASMGNKNMLGKRHTEEAKSKISIAGKGKTKPPRTAEHNRHQSEAQKGKIRKPLSLEHRQNISAGKQNISDATRKRLSDAAKRQHARKRISDDNR